MCKAVTQELDGSHNEADTPWPWLIQIRFDDGTVHITEDPSFGWFDDYEKQNTVDKGDGIEEELGFTEENDNFQNESAESGSDSSYNSKDKRMPNGVWFDLCVVEGQFNPLRQRMPI